MISILLVAILLMAALGVLCTLYACLAIKQDTTDIIRMLEAWEDERTHSRERFMSSVREAARNDSTMRRS